MRACSIDSADSYEVFRVSDSEIKLRPERSSDLPFLRSLYGSTRVDVVFSTLPEEQKQQFIDMQFDAQRHHYCTYYDNTDFQIIEKNHRPIGRLYLNRGRDEIRVMDLILIPEFRKQGIGSRLLRAVQSEANSLGLPVTLHAEKFGNVVEFYKQLGFEIVEVKEEHFFMKWTTGAPIIIT